MPGVAQGAIQPGSHVAKIIAEELRIDFASAETLKIQVLSGHSDLPPGSPSLGELLSQAKGNVQAPWLGFTGFFSVAIMLSLLIFIGEAVRDAFDPRARAFRPRLPILRKPVAQK